MQPHHMAALLFAMATAPCWLFARWLGDGRLPLAGGNGGMTERERRALDGKLARMMRMIGFAGLATAIGIALLGAREAQMMALVLVFAIAVFAVSIAMLVAVSRARGGRGTRG